VTLDGTSAALLLRRGAVAGLAGVVAESAWSQREKAILGGHPPVFDPERMTRRLVHRLTGRWPSQRTARLCGLAMRSLYGPAWGVLGAMPRLVRQPRVRTSALVLGSAIWGFELFTLPRVGATPPAREWSREEIALDATNAALFALVTSVVLALIDSPRRGHRGRAAEPQAAPRPAS
jgi:hypothetical protein